ncbi:hypothetical protein [Sphingomonas sp.]|uniref:hypothetical protein n=1 Tax=Sphingomonas sp. TaxID=28214 RepID=UPI0026012F13|nr:hypothetical protein [Sphingomonas sp.]
MPNLAAPSPTVPASADAAAQGDQAGKRAFMAQTANQRTVSVERLMALASPNIVHARTKPSRHPATTCRASSILATKYCVPRASLGAVATGEGMATGLSAGSAR